LTVTCYIQVIQLQTSNPFVGKWGIESAVESNSEEANCFS